MKYKKHVFICTNQKEGGKRCCGEEKGIELVNAFKEAIKLRGLQMEMRAQKTGCLDACNFGPALVVYPEGTYYGHVQPEDVQQIIEQHLLQNQPVTRLVLPY
jgi:(2Fe-2S) ferredoxin